MSVGNGKLMVNGKEINLPIVEGTQNELAVDISNLRSETGVVTLDNGLMNTGACTSAITFLDGEKGILQYRGYPIDQLAESSHFVDVAHLLLFGGESTEPTQGLDQKKAFEAKTSALTKLPDSIQQLIHLSPQDAHPMGVLLTTLASLNSYYPEYSKEDLSKVEKDNFFPFMMDIMNHLVAAQYRRSLNLKPLKSKQESYCRNFFHLMFGEKFEKLSQTQQEVLEHALDVLLILHADHEQNCSTSTVRIVGSSKANPLASLTAGVAALWGSSHGGANQAVLEMLEHIQKDGGDYKKFIAKAKDKNESFRLMGFGHRVYKNFDPRAKIIKRICDSLLNKLNIQTPILDIAKGLEEEALKDPYFIERKLYPNVDFYSGIIYKAMEIPVPMMTVMFALGRLPGWMAQWNELTQAPFKIVRPRQIYVGPKDRNFPAQKLSRPF